MEGLQDFRGPKTLSCRLLEIVKPPGEFDRLPEANSRFPTAFVGPSSPVPHSCVPLDALTLVPNDPARNHRLPRITVCPAASDVYRCQLLVRAQAQSERRMQSTSYHIQRMHSHALSANATKDDRRTERCRRAQQRHQSPVPCFGFLAEEIRFGSFPPSRPSPCRSWDASAMSAGRSVIPKTNITVAITRSRHPDLPFQL